MKKIIKFITWISAIAFVLSGSALDSNSWLPYVVCAVSVAWLILMVIANREALERYEC